MLKHKIRKSRKNILSLLDYANEHEDDGKFPEYSEIKKPSRKEQKKKKGTYLNHQSRHHKSFHIMFTKTAICLHCIIYS